MAELENASMRLRIERDGGGNYAFVADVRDADGWRPASGRGSRPLESLTPSEAGPDFLAGAGEGYTWRTQFTPQASGFRVETVLYAASPIDLAPAMILWLGGLDNLDDRQADTWRQTLLRAPTVNQQGLPGNDLAAGYLYDHATRTETILYFPADAFKWAPNRFYYFTVREVMAYQPAARYGIGLVPTAPETRFRLEPGEHRFVWWFTQRPRETIPSPWEAQTALLEAVAPLLDPVPALTPGAPGWQTFASRTLDDLSHEECWVEVGGHQGLRAYVRGSSAVQRDEARGFELMTQLDVLWPLLLWQRATGDTRAEPIAERLRATLPLFARPELNYVANNFPPRPSDSFMDTWYFLENALIKLPWVAYLTGDPALHDMFLTALRGAQRLARHTNYLFPLFADASDWRPRASLLNVSVGGLYAAGHVIAAQLESDSLYLLEAAAALRTMHQLPPHQLTHEPQQLTFAAASAAYLARVGFEGADWARLSADFLNLSLRMGYWAPDPAVPFYDPRGMFQACASLCYPAFKENVEVLLAWPELLRTEIGPAPLLGAFANLQRAHNVRFFDPYLPETLRRGPCPYIPYEDLATAEFSHTAELGKELYGAGEVFWSALHYDALGQVDAPDVLCLCLDVPCVELRPIPPTGERRFLLYSPRREAHTVTLRSGDQAREIVLEPRTAVVTTV